MYLSAAAKRAFPGVAVRLLNTAVEPHDPVALTETLRSFVPDVVGFRALAIARERLIQLMRDVRALLPEVPLVVGGPHATCEPESILRDAPACFVISGEGERSFVQFLEHLGGTREIGAVGGLHFCRGAEVVHNASAELIADLDALPYPDYTVLNEETYAGVLSYGYTLRRQGLILSSRGCPFACKYCFKTMGRGFRARCATSVVDEIEYLRRERNIQDITFVDDTFNLDARRVRAIFQGVRDRGLDCRFYFPAGLRAELMTRELVDLLVEAGTSWITYAVESAVPRINELAGRNGDPETAAGIIDYTVRKGIMVGLFLMVGFPTETYAEAMETIRYARQRKGVTMPYLFAVRYFPHTELTQLGLSMGAIAPEAIETSRLAYHDISGSETSTLTRKDFQNLFVEYMKTVLLDPERLQQALAVQERFLTSAEIDAAYSALLGRTIRNPRRVFRYILGRTEHDDA